MKNNKAYYCILFQDVIEFTQIKIEAQDVMRLLLLMQQGNEGGALAERLYLLHEVESWVSRKDLFNCHYLKVMGSYH